MFINNLINKFGYSEMYEWSELFKYNIVPFGRFVTFADNEIGKIKLANENDFIIGVTTINSAYTSDDPEEWQGKYLSNEYGDILIKKSSENENTANIYGINVTPLINESYDKQLAYKKRSDRNEWVRVNLIGKCIVEDNGGCKSCQWCTSNDVYLDIRSVIPSIDFSQNSQNSQNSQCKYYVIDRISDNTIMIFFK